MAWDDPISSINALRACGLTAALACKPIFLCRIPILIIFYFAFGLSEYNCPHLHTQRDINEEQICCKFKYVYVLLTLLLVSLCTVHNMFYIYTTVSSNPPV